MNGRSTETQTTSTSSAPWGPSQDFLKGNMGLANKYLQAGVGQQIPKFNTVAGFNKNTTAGMQGMLNLARSNTGGDGISGEYGSVIDQGGFNSAQLNSYNAMNLLGQQSMANPYLDGFAAVAGGEGTSGSYSETNLENLANGQNLGRDNADFERALEAATNRAQLAVNLNASGNGRYGSGANHTNLIREIGDLQATSRMQQYENDRNAMITANNMLDNQRMGNLVQRLNAMNSGANFYNQGINAAMGAASDMYNMGQQSFNNLETAYRGQQLGYNDMMQVGSMREQMEQQRIQARLDKHYATQNLPWDNLARANAIYSGAGSLGGSSQQTATGPGQNPFATALGYGSSAIGIAGGLQNLGFFGG